MIVVFVGAPRGSGDGCSSGGPPRAGKQLWFGHHPMVGNGLLSERYVKKAAVSTGGLVYPVGVPVRQFYTAVQGGAGCGFQSPTVVFNPN
jgi:hypothetical protein